MESINIRKAKKSLVKQHGLSDCGVACLASIIKWKGGEKSLESLRKISGTTKQGTTMLGLYQAAKETGFEADAYEANIAELKKIDTPVILHYTIADQLLHYVVCYGYVKDKFIIGDPSSGIHAICEEELKQTWKTRTLLYLKPTANFESKKERFIHKKQWLLAIVREDIHILLTALFVGLIVTVLGLSTAIFSQKLIDDILPNKDYDKLILGLALLFVLTLGNSIFSYVRGFLLLKQSRAFNNRIVNKFYKTLLYLPQSFFDTRKTGELISRMKDTGRIQSTISFLLSKIIIGLLVLVVSTIYTFIYSSTVGIIYSLSIPTYILLAWLYHRRIVTSQRAVMVSSAKNESNFIDTIQGMDTIKTQNKQSTFEDITKSIFGTLQTKSFMLGKLNLGYSLISGIIGSGFSISIISILALNVLNNHISLGEMVAILTISGNIIPTVTSLTNANVQLQEARVAFERMFDVVETKGEATVYKHPTATLKSFNKLIVQDLQFRFPGRSPLLKDISFELRKGEMITLLGESGCGKSTILKILQKFYHPSNQSTSITVNNSDWEELDINEWRSLVGYVPQQIKIFNTTLINNITLYDDLKEAEKVVQFCQEFGFDRFFSKLPQNYFTILGEEGINISGGQKQLVALARALYTNPQLLLLDETTAAMDRLTENFVLDLLSNLKTRSGIILVTHRIKTASRADRIYTIENGRITHTGNHNELMMSDNFYSTSYQELMF